MREPAGREVKKKKKKRRRGEEEEKEDKKLRVKGGNTEVV